MSESISINSSTVDQVVAEALAAITAATDIAALRTSRNATVGEQSPIAKLNAALKNLPHEEKAAAGALIGKARGELGAAFAAREAELGKVDLGPGNQAQSCAVTARSRRGFGRLRLGLCGTRHDGLGEGLHVGLGDAAFEARAFDFCERHTQLAGELAHRGRRVWQTRGASTRGVGRRCHGSGG